MSRTTKMIIACVVILLLGNAVIRCVFGNKAFPPAPPGGL